MEPLDIAVLFLKVCTTIIFSIAILYFFAFASQIASVRQLVHLGQGHNIILVTYGFIVFLFFLILIVLFVI